MSVRKSIGIAAVVALLPALGCLAGACAGSKAGGRPAVASTPVVVKTLPAVIPAAGVLLRLPSDDLALMPATDVNLAALKLPTAADAKAVYRAVCYGTPIPPTVVLAFATVTNIDPPPRGFPVVSNRLCWALSYMYIEPIVTFTRVGTPSRPPCKLSVDTNIALIDARTGQYLCDFGAGGRGWGFDAPAGKRMNLTRPSAALDCSRSSRRSCAAR